MKLLRSSMLKAANSSAHLSEGLQIMLSTKTSILLCLVTKTGMTCSSGMF